MLSGGTFSLLDSDIKKLKGLGTECINKTFRFNCSPNGQPTSGWHFWFLVKPTYFETGASLGCAYCCFQNQNNQIVQMNINYSNGTIYVKSRY